MLEPQPGMNFLEVVSHWVNTWGLLATAIYSHLSAPRIALYAASCFLLYRVNIVIYRLWFHPLATVPGPTLLAATHLPLHYWDSLMGTWVHRVPELHRRYGPIVRIGPNDLVIDGSIAWPDVWARKGKDEFLKPQEFFFPGDGLGILNAKTTEIHRRQRRQLGVAFSEAAVQGQERVIDRHIDHLLQKISEDASKGGSVDIIKWIHSAAFDIICDLTYSDTFHCLDSTEHHSWVLGIFYGVKKAVNKNFFFLSPIIEFLQTLVDTVKLVQAAKAQYYLAVDKAMVRIAEGKRSHTGRQDYISQMLKKNASGERSMSDEEISVNSLFLITAGSDTSATALPALLFYLRSNKEAYNTLTEEIRWAFDTERAINNRSTSSLEYLRACIDEALRMHPPLPSITPRISTGFFVRGLWVPEGTRINTTPWATFRDPQYFTDPDSFHPERFLPRTHPLYEERFANDNLAVWKPFSYGARDCIGKNLAYAEMRVIAARFLHRFDYTIDKGSEGWHDNLRIFFMWQKAPLMLKVTPWNAPKI